MYVAEYTEFKNTDRLDVKKYESKSEALQAVLKIVQDHTHLPTGYRLKNMVVNRLDVGTGITEWTPYELLTYRGNQDGTRGPVIMRRVVQMTVTDPISLAIRGR